MNNNKRTAEFALGLVGGIVGIIMGVLATFIGGTEAAIENIENSSVVASGWAAAFLSLIGIAASIIVRNKAKLGGALMLFAAIGGFIAIPTLYVMPGVLLGVGGIMAFARKEQ